MTGTADFAILHLALLRAASLASSYAKATLSREVGISGKCNTSFVAFSVWCICIAVGAGSFVNRVWFCGILTRSILSSHAAHDHLVCVRL